MHRDFWTKNDVTKIPNFAAEMVTVSIMVGAPLQNSQHSSLRHPIRLVRRFGLGTGRCLQ